MISILALIKSSSDELGNIKNFIVSLKSKTKNFDNIELIVKLDNPSQKKVLDKVIEELNPEFRTLPFIQIRSNEIKGIHAAYDNLYLQISDESKLLILISDKAQIIEDGWDEILLKKYRSSEESLGHELFLFKQNSDDLVIVSSSYVDTIGGFGHSPKVYSWMEKINDALIKNFDINLILSLEQDLIFDNSENHPVVVDYDSVFIKEVIKFQSVSIAISSNSRNKLKIIKRELRKFSLTEACSYINKKFGSFDSCMIAIVRYFHSTTQYIIRFHAIPFIDVITGMTLCKSNQLRYRGLFPTDWIKHVDKWTMDDAEPIKVIPDDDAIKWKIEIKKNQSSEDQFIIDTASRYGKFESLIFLTRRAIILPIRKLLRK
ncbi:MAG: hypothetical protein EBS06_04420 [Proteobacteria bacterium]|nr:hypothetical protein [Pseudomonadota bacterium]